MVRARIRHQAIRLLGYYAMWQVSKHQESSYSALEVVGRVFVVNCLCVLRGCVCCVCVCFVFVCLCVCLYCVCSEFALCSAVMFSINDFTNVLQQINDICGINPLLNC